MGKAIRRRLERPLRMAQDKFGLPWQMVNTGLLQMLQDPDSQKADRVMRAMMEMDKLDIQRLQQAYNQP